MFFCFKDYNFKKNKFSNVSFLQPLCKAICFIMNETHENEIGMNDMSNSRSLMLKQATAGNLQRYTLRIDQILFQKFRYVAKYNGRSVNKELEQCIKKWVVKFETAHGMIEIDDCK